MVQNSTVVQGGSHAVQYLTRRGDVRLILTSAVGLQCRKTSSFNIKDLVSPISDNRVGAHSAASNYNVNMQGGFRWVGGGAEVGVTQCAQRCHFWKNAGRHIKAL